MAGHGWGRSWGFDCTATTAAPGALKRQAKHLFGPMETDREGRMKPEPETG